MKPPTLREALNDWLAVIKRAKSANTYRTYKFFAGMFLDVAGRVSITALSDSLYGKYLDALKSTSPSTEKQGATIISLFYEYVSAKRIVPVNMDSIRFMRRNETRKIPKRLRRMDMPAIEKIMAHVENIKPGKDVHLARAKAIVLTLGESGLRASEACEMRISHLDPKTMTGVVIGKGNKEARYMIGDNMLRAVMEYHRLRREKSDWVFLSHSRRDGKTPRHVEYATARRDVLLICKLILDQEPQYNITPHVFRHYFVTLVWRRTGDLKLTQEAARHDNISTTDRYVHADNAAETVGKKMRAHE